MTSESSMTLIEYLQEVGVDPNGDFLQQGARLWRRWRWSWKSRSRSAPASTNGRRNG